MPSADPTPESQEDGGQTNLTMWFKREAPNPCHSKEDRFRVQALHSPEHQKAIGNLLRGAEWGCETPRCSYPMPRDGLVCIVWDCMIFVGEVKLGMVVIIVILIMFYGVIVVFRIIWKQYCSNIKILYSITVGLRLPLRVLWGPRPKNPKPNGVKLLLKHP